MTVALVRFIKSFDNSLDKLVADDVLLSEAYYADAVEPVKDFARAHEPVSGTIGEVDLRRVSCYDEFGVDAHACEEHLDLWHGGVLRLIENYKGVG